MEARDFSAAVCDAPLRGGSDGGGGGGRGEGDLGLARGESGRSRSEHKDEDELSEGREKARQIGRAHV